MLQKTVAAMTTNQYSDIIETDVGYQIVFVQNVVEAKNKSLAEVESEIHDILYEEIVDNKFQIWIEDLQKRSHVKVIN